MNILPFKRCTKCGEIKSKSEFNKRKASKKDGLEAQCRECRHAYTATHREGHREDEKERARLWRTGNAERHRQYTKNWISKNSERVKEYKQVYRSTNFEKIREFSKKWKGLNWEKVLTWSRTRRAKKKGNGGTITATEWQSVLEKYSNKCLYPGCNRTDIQMDHVVPLALGGTHTIDNVQPLCKHHNNSKGIKVIDYR